MDSISVFNNGFVRLDGHMADDISVVNSARVSFGKRTEVIGDADSGLIRFLMRSRHGTPFELQLVPIPCKSTNFCCP